MKRRILIFSIFMVFGVLAFGANAALAGFDFNPQTGVMFYSPEGLAVDSGDDVLVRRAESVGFTSWTKIVYKGYQFGQPTATPNMAKYCFHEDYVLWACPAKSVKVVGNHGNDTITVNSNVTIPTTLIGAGGIDVLHGGAGDDVLDGGLGPDQLYGGLGKDTADYSSRVQPITASLNDTGDDGEVNEHDNIHNDLEGIVGGSSNDVLVGNGSTNTLSGGPGDDTLRGKLGADVLQGGPGYDMATYDERTQPVTAGTDGVANDGEAGEQDNVGTDVENLTGGSGNDTLTGSFRQNILIGNGGNDKLYGAPMYALGITWGPDKLYGGPDQDLLYGGWPGSTGDYLDGSSGVDMVTYADRSQGVTINLADFNVGEDHISGVENATGGAGDDTMIGNDGPNTFFAGAGYDNLTGGGGNDVLGGQDGNDTIDGGAGHDVVSGGKNDDMLIGGPNDDYISGHEGTDIVTYAGYQVPVSVSLDGAYNDGAAGEGDDVLADVEVVIGGEKNDTLVGDDDPNVIYGGGGNDTLSGLGGNDALDGQAGTDSVDGGAATDLCQGETMVNCENGGGGGQPSVTLTATPSNVAPGAAVTVTWSNVANPKTTDRIALYHPGDANADALGYKYTSSCTTKAGATAKSSGSCSFYMTAGTYEFRLFVGGTETVLVTSGKVTVG